MFTSVDERVLSDQFSNFLTPQDLDALSLVSKQCNRIAQNAALLAVRSVEDLLEADKSPQKWSLSDLQRLRACLSLPYPSISYKGCTFTTNANELIIMRQDNNLIAAIDQDGLIYKTLKWNAKAHGDVLVFLDTQSPLCTIDSKKCVVCGLKQCLSKTETACALRFACWFGKLYPHKIWSPTARRFLLSDNLSIRVA